MITSFEEKKNKTEKKLVGLSSAHLNRTWHSNHERKENVCTYGFRQSVIVFKQILALPLSTLLKSTLLGQGLRIQYSLLTICLQSPVELKDVHNSYLSSIILNVYNYHARNTYDWSCYHLRWGGCQTCFTDVCYSKDVDIDDWVE